MTLRELLTSVVESGEWQIHVSISYTAETRYEFRLGLEPEAELDNVQTIRRPYEERGS